MWDGSWTLATSSKPIDNAVQDQTHDIDLGAAKIIDPLNPGSAPSYQKMDTTPAPESASMQLAITIEELHLWDHTEPDNILGEGDGMVTPTCWGS